MYGMFPWTATSNCPSCGRPKVDGVVVDPAADSAYVDIVKEFLKVDRIESVSDRVGALQKVYRFVKRDDVDQGEDRDD